MQTPYDNLTDAELIRKVDNDPNATPMERALAERLDMRRRDLRDALAEVANEPIPGDPT